MAESFDPYYKWLGIPPQDQPPHHYRLLGLNLFESDPDVIDAAANQRMAFLQSCAHGPHIALTQKLLNEVAAARVCLLNPQSRAAYDQELRQRFQATEGASAPRPAKPKRVPPAEPARRTRPAPPADEASSASFLPADEPAPSPVLAASTVARPAPARRSSRTLVVAASVATVALLGGIILWLATSGGEADRTAGLEGIVLDDTKAEAIGNWQRLSDSDTIGPHYLAADGQGNNTVTYHLDTLQPGYYRVRLAYVPGDDRATNATVAVIAGSQPNKPIKVDQRQVPSDGRFHTLGTFNFTGSSRDAIQISTSGADGRVTVDAVQLIRE